MAGNGYPRSLPSESGDSKDELVRAADYLGRAVAGRQGWKFFSVIAVHRFCDLESGEKLGAAGTSEDGAPATERIGGKIIADLVLLGAGFFGTTEGAAFTRVTMYT